MITLCMIVKNEEISLEKCLSKIINLVDEIVIVDTGSSDKTKEIAFKFTDKVYDFKWCNDFSKARNFSIDKASNDWILILDADEFIKNFKKDYVLNFISNDINVKKVGRIECINMMEDSSGTKRCFERINRLFNRNYFHYEGIIHEQLTSKNGEAYETENTHIAVEHFGYTKQVLNRTNKLERNINLLKKSLNKKECDPYIYYQLGKSYYMLKAYDEASTYFEKAISCNPNYNLEYAEDLVETYGYSLINSKKYSKALKIKKFEKIYNNCDFNFLMALIYMNNGKFTLAVETFLKCTDFKKARVEGTNSYLAFYNIGVIYDVLGLKEEAIKYYAMHKQMSNIK